MNPPQNPGTLHKTRIIMKTALVIFNGIKFPFYLAEQAIAWAKDNTADLQALFLVGKEPGEGYVFPSDLDAAEKLADRNEAREKNIEIIRDQVKLLEDMARTKNVTCRSELLMNPSLKDVVNKAGHVERIFVDADYDNTGLLSVTHFSLDHLLGKASCPVETVAKNN